MTGTIELLRRMPVFGGIDDDALEFLLSEAQAVHVPKGAAFFRENDLDASLFVIERGKAVVLKSYREHNHVLKELEEGDCFGEMELIDFFPRVASVVATEDCTALRLTAASLHKLYKKDLKQFTLVYMNLAREISRRLRDADSKLFATRIEADAGEGNGEPRVQP